VTIGRDTTIMPGAHLRGRTTTGRSCRIGPQTVVVDCQIGDGCVVMMSALAGLALEAGAEIGPFAHLRGGS
jgi:bifunctional UDP-N-acetylglucosamine pyrophosphorylase/glucosamine-1-phosphate N-acetyltransferase